MAIVGNLIQLIRRGDLEKICKGSDVDRADKYLEFKGSIRNLTKRRLSKTRLFIVFSLPAAGETMF